MEGLFLKLINMSVTASYVILLVIFIRLLLKSVPKIYSYGLWLIVLFRLLLPFSFSSVFSMIPMSTNQIPEDIMYAAKPEIHSGITRIDRVVNNSLPTPVVAASVNPIQVWLLIWECIWLAGMLILLIYSIVSTLKLTKQLKSSKHLKGNIYLVNHIETPFVFGLLRPKIYLPFGLSEIEESYMIKHEETHIKRFDHIIKFTSFIATAIHWFNPLVWLAFFLMSRDMELSCDEKVISEMGSGIKKDYSHSLLSLSSSKKVIGSSPLAFGGENTKGRIKNILNYKKPKFWASLVGMIAIVVAVMGLLSNPKSNDLLAGEEGQLIKGFLENYYAQLSYTGEEQEDIEKEIMELSSIISLNGDLRYIPTSYENQISQLPYETSEIKKDTTYDKISTYMKEVSTATFSPYYELLEFNISNYEEEMIDGSVHATFYYQIVEKNYDKDPDTVGYIKEAKENGSSYYQQMYDEYLGPRESNFDLKIIIDENDLITLYSNVSPNGIEWEETKMDDYILSNDDTDSDNGKS